MRQGDGFFDAEDFRLVYRRRFFMINMIFLWGLYVLFWRYSWWSTSSAFFGLGFFLTLIFYDFYDLR